MVVAAVYAIVASEVVCAGSDYPGRVVFVRHAADHFPIYGHLDHAVVIEEGKEVGRGEFLGSVLARFDAVSNRLHLEVRTFLTTPAVNGATPRCGLGCGVDCPPGPGYWPIAAPDHPSDRVGATQPTSSPGAASAPSRSRRPPRSSSPPTP